MFIFLYLVLALAVAFCGVHHDRRIMRHHPTTFGDLVIYFIFGLIPLVNLYMLISEGFYIIKDANVFKFVIWDAPVRLEAKKKEAIERQRRLEEARKNKGITGFEQL